LVFTGLHYKDGRLQPHRSTFSTKEGLSLYNLNMPANDGTVSGHPPNAMTAAIAKWTNSVPVDTNVYGENKLGCSEGALRCNRGFAIRLGDTAIW
jgi:hypothetical protein